MTVTPIPVRLTQYPRFRVLFCAWTTLGLLAFARYFLLADAPKRNLLLALLGWLSCYYSWLLFTPVLFRLEASFPLGKRWTHLAVLGLLGVPVSYCAYQLTLFLNAGVQLVFRTTVPLPPRWWIFPAREFALEQALYWFTIGATCLIRNIYDLREKERMVAELALEKAELESSLRRAELETLRIRLNPHFLFNCLQSIASLSQKSPKVAGQMVTRLGELLRTALRHQTEAESTLEEELRLSDAYITLEQMRFDDRISVLRDIEAGTEQALIPAFLLQPILENAIKHGLRTENKAGLIWIKSSRQLSQLILTISDNGIGVSSAQLSELEVGIGIGSTCERLEHMYGQQHSFSIRPLAEGGTEVRIAIPCKFANTSDTFTHDHIEAFDRRR